MFELKKRPLKLSQISKKLDFTPQGTVRNITRLIEIDLVRRNEASDYMLTPYVVTYLNLLGSFLFISQNKDYMSTHWTDKLPLEFQARLGELMNCERIDDPFDMMTNMERQFGEAEEFHYYLTPLSSTRHHFLKIALDRLDNGVKLRIIVPIEYELSGKSLENVSPELIRALQDHLVKGNAQYRYLDDINLRICMSEKEVSILNFPMIDEEVDLVGFSSTDPYFHHLCLDLFNYYWERGKTKTTNWTAKALVVVDSH